MSNYNNNQRFNFNPNFNQNFNPFSFNNVSDRRKRTGYQGKNFDPNYRQNMINQSRQQNNQNFHSTPKHSISNQTKRHKPDSSFTKTPPADNSSQPGAKTKIDVLIGDVLHYLPTAESLISFKSQNLKHPKKAALIKTKDYDLKAIKDLKDKVIDLDKQVIRNVIYFPREHWFTTQRAGGNPNMHDYDSLLDGGDGTKSVIEMKIGELMTKYKATSTFVVIDGSLNFQAAVASSCILTGSIGMILNPINHPAFASLSKEDQPGAFIRRTSHFIKYHHCERGPELNQLSDDRPIFLDELDC